VATRNLLNILVLLWTHLKAKFFLMKEIVAYFSKQRGLNYHKLLKTMPRSKDQKHFKRHDMNNTIDLVFMLNPFKI